MGEWNGWAIFWSMEIAVGEKEKRWWRPLEESRVEQRDKDEEGMKVCWRRLESVVDFIFTKGGS